MTIKPHELHKKRLEARGERNMAGGKHPTPSEKHSKSLRKKLNRDAPAIQEIRYDCNRCPQEPCGANLGDCGKSRRIIKCKQCGLNFTYRFDLQNIFEYCTPCRISLERNV